MGNVCSLTAASLHRAVCSVVNWSSSNAPRSRAARSCLNRLGSRVSSSSYIVVVHRIKFYSHCAREQRTALRAFGGSSRVSWRRSYGPLDELSVPFRAVMAHIPIITITSCSDSGPRPFLQLLSVSRVDNCTSYELESRIKFAGGSLFVVDQATTLA